MAANSAHLEWFRYEDLVIEFDIDPAQDILGWTVIYSISLIPGGTQLITKTATIQTAVDDNMVTYSTGKMFVTVTKANNTTLAAGNYYWELRRTDSGNNRVLAYGTVELILERTAQT